MRRIDSPVVIARSGDGALTERDRHRASVVGLFRSSVCRRGGRLVARATSCRRGPGFGQVVIRPGRVGVDEVAVLGATLVRDEREVKMPPDRPREVEEDRGDRNERPCAANCAASSCGRSMTHDLALVPEGSLWVKEVWIRHLPRARRATLAGPDPGDAARISPVLVHTAPR